jgi:preprotein translocase subunit SecD
MKIPIRVWILIAALLLSLLAIKPSFQDGVVVQSVEQDSEFFLSGLRNGEIITSINGEGVLDKEGYASVVEGLGLGTSIGEQRIEITTKEGNYISFVNDSLGITVSDVPRTRIQTGLDLRGGSRALVSPDEDISESEMNDLIEVSRNRFNVYGLSDVNIKSVRDLSGNRFMLVEVAGASPDDLETLIGEQGKFEARIGNETVFTGGEKDISDVCRNDASCASITQCLPDSEGGYFCSFAFTIFLTEGAAQKHASVTEGLGLDASGQYLDQSLFLYVDDKEVDSLLIGASLRGQVTTQISIQGSGQGLTEQDAIDDTRASMSRLQTILITGSLPYKLNIEKLDTISPVLGKDFTNSIILAGAAAILLVSVIVFFRYRRIKASIALLFTSFSELVIILGVASLIGWNLDLPSIAGILATIGTGVDQQIVILDEARTGRSVSISTRMKRALFVVMTAYLTSLVALLPLYWAGAGLFKGFAITTIIGITAGVFISRPAFAAMIQRMEE